MILFILYMAAGYWAANRTVYANKIVFGAWNAIIVQKCIVALFLGWILIPVAIIKMFIGR